MAISSPLAEGPGCLYSCPTCNTEQLGNGSSQFVDDFPIAKKPPFSLGMFGISQPRLITKGYPKASPVDHFCEWLDVGDPGQGAVGREETRETAGREETPVSAVRAVSPVRAVRASPLRMQQERT